MGNEYYSTGQKTVSFQSETISEHYASGYVLTRLGKGIMNQTRSLRIDLERFSLNSENRRILRRTEGLEMTTATLPYEDYSWEIHKLGKDYYERKFGPGTISASKIKEMFVDDAKSNMNFVLKFESESKTLGYVLCYENGDMLHYAYPFYDLDVEISNSGMGMMIRGIEYAKDSGKKYVYLGSVTDEASKYKLQFEGLEWWDGGGWNGDLDWLKDEIQNSA